MSKLAGVVLQLQISTTTFFKFYSRSLGINISQALIVRSLSPFSSGLGDLLAAGLNLNILCHAALYTLERPLEWSLLSDH